MTQQIHSFRASGVRSLQAARAVAPELRAARISLGILCTGPGLVWFFSIIRLSHHVLPEGNPGDLVRDGFNADEKRRAMMQRHRVTLEESFSHGHQKTQIWCLCHPLWEGYSDPLV